MDLWIYDGLICKVSETCSKYLDNFITLIEK